MYSNENITTVLCVSIVTWWWLFQKQRVSSVQ